MLPKTKENVCFLNPNWFNFFSANWGHFFVSKHSVRHEYPTINNDGSLRSFPGFIDGFIRLVNIIILPTHCTHALSVSLRFVVMEITDGKRAQE